MNIRWTTVIPCALIALAGASPALAGDVDITKNRDSDITVWNTLLGFRYGDPVYRGRLPRGHRLRLREGWLTDLSVEQDPLAMGLHNTTTGMAVVTGGPGGYTMEDLTNAVSSLVGPSGRLAVPDLASSFFDIFVTIDLDDFHYGGGGALPFGSQVDFSNGRCDIPGLTAGLAPFTFDARAGWTSPHPFTGTLEVIGEMGLRVPTPGAGALALSAGLLALRRRR